MTLMKRIPQSLHEALEVLDGELTTQQRREIQRMSRQQLARSWKPCCSLT